MDPISAFALAGNVLQFSEYAVKLLKDTWQILSKGQLQSDAMAAANAERMIRLMKATELSGSCQRFKIKLQHDLPATTQELNLEKMNEALWSACQECLVVAQNLLDILEEVKVESEYSKDQRSRKSRKRQTPLPMEQLYVIFLRVWNKGKIDDLTAKLGRASKLVETSFLLSMGTKIDFLMAKESERFKTLSHDNQMIVRSLLEGQAATSHKFDQQAKALTTLLSRVEYVIGFHEEGSMRLITDVLKDASGSTEKLPSQILTNAIFERQQRDSISREILDDLQMKVSRPRFDDVVEAHDTTFHWIYEQPDVQELQRSKRIWSDFTQWLQNGSGIYWVSGKPASGKSTLMKYIISHTRTSELLQRWSASFPDSSRNHLCTAKFFFWLSSGDKNQSSQNGLLRSILHEVCSKYPRLLPTLFPELWSKRYNQRIRSQTDDDGPQDLEYHSLPVSWSLSTLTSALKCLASQTQYPIQICLFIDGLDEYEGDDIDIAKLFLSISKYQNIKCCVSSRPHQPFIRAFRDQPSLRLQDFTRPDIARYVSDKLARDPLWDEISVGNEGQATQLIEEIVSCAQGVFLWVKLVVKSLLRGRGNGDGLAELQHRLREFPTELEGLYEKMVSVENVYKAEASRIFRLVYEASELDAPMTELTLLQMAVALKTSARQTPTILTNSPVQSAIDLMCQKMARDVVVMCGGLLEIQQQASMEEASSGLLVSYLHRTVKEYLQGRGRQDYLQSVSNDSSEFDPLQGMLAAYTLHLKLELDSQIRLSPQHPTENVIRTTLRCLSKLQAQVNTKSHPQHIQQCATVFQLARQLSWSKESVKEAFPPRKTKESIATESCQSIYLEHLLSSKEPPTTDEMNTLLETAIISNSLLDPGLEKVLMKFGPDTEEVYARWLQFLSRLKHYDFSNAQHIIKFFLRSGKIIKEEDLDELKTRLPEDLWEQIETDNEIQSRVKPRTPALQEDLRETVQQENPKKPMQQDDPNNLLDFPPIISAEMNPNLRVPSPVPSSRSATSSTRDRISEKLRRVTRFRRRSGET